MRTFSCYCGNRLYFDNNQCLNCGRFLGFLPDQLKLAPMEQVADDQWQKTGDTSKSYRQCAHYKNSNVCNWMVDSSDEEVFCEACRLNEVIPDLSKPENVDRWYKLEQSKRRLIYTLLALRLPILNFKQDPDNGLAFRFMEDVTESNPYSDEMVTYEQIMTGHHTGTITINIIEADDSQREAIRTNMNESYRTTLGHFRHEIGHYYWEKLIDHSPHLYAFRELFGDERNDYQQSLSHYYQFGGNQDWSDTHISAYASVHPWEDWAETWAHYLHITELFDTAGHHRVTVDGDGYRHHGTTLRDWLQKSNFNDLMSKLGNLTIALNEMNRSLGFPDVYPFQHSPTVIKKLGFVHDIIMAT